MFGVRHEVQIPAAPLTSLVSLGNWFSETQFSHLLSGDNDDCHEDEMWARGL